MKEHCTYKTSHPNGYYYIGKATMSAISRGYKGSGFRLRDYFKKYPKDEWVTVVVQIFDTEEEAYAHEAELVTEETLKDPLCVNLIPGGVGGRKWESGLDRGEKISAAMKGKKRGPQRPETIEKRRRTFLTPEVSNKLAHRKGVKIVLDEEKKKKYSENMRKTMEEYRNRPDVAAERERKREEKRKKREEWERTAEQRKENHYSVVSKKVSGGNNGTARRCFVGDMEFSCLKHALEYTGEKYVYKLKQLPNFRFAE